MRFQQLARSTAKTFSTAVVTKRVQSLPDGSLQGFKQHAFIPEIPALLRQGLLGAIPASSKWFNENGDSKSSLSTAYLERFSSMLVPLEITNLHSQTQPFTKVERPLADFLSFIDMQQQTWTQTVPGRECEAVQIYLAQCSIASLPPELMADLPTPPLVSGAGRGDVYDSSIWLGLAPTYTSLHKDPNPNLFVQLAGRKIVRIFEPQVGAELFAEAQRRIGAHGSVSFRGEEMMYGQEKSILEELVWSGTQEETEGQAGGINVSAYEAVLDGGDGIFIPKGWWHSVKGVGRGIVGSANWWFR